MSTSNTLIYAGDSLGPASINANASDISNSGFTTILLGLSHIGRGPDAYQPVAGQQTGDIVFNNPADDGLIMISEGNYVGPENWPSQLNALMGNNITRMGLSVGGGGCLDYETIWSNFIVNGSISGSSVLYKNFVTLKQQFPFISFIDFDCEEFSSAYDPEYNWVETIIAFGNMLKEIGFDITFCPYCETSGWMKALSALYSTSSPTVLWLNLQCYDGGGGNDPVTWAEAVSNTLSGVNGFSLIVSGLWCCNTAKSYCGSTPTAVKNQFSDWQLQAGKMNQSFRGGFIWNYEDVLANENSNACNPQYGGSKTSADYCSAINKGLAAG